MNASKHIFPFHKTNSALFAGAPRGLKGLMAGLTLVLAACGGGTAGDGADVTAASADGRQRAAAVSVSGSVGSVIGNYWPNAFVVRPHLSFSYFPGAPAVRRDELPGLVLPAGQGPAPGLPSVQYSARWYGLITPTVSGDYTFRLELSDKDSGTLNLDGKSVVAVTPVSNRSATGALTLTAGTPITMKLEFVHNQGAAMLKLRWKRPGSTVFEPLPASVFSKAVNLPPTISSIPAQINYPLEKLNIPFSWSDPENDELSFDATAVPPRVNIQSAVAPFLPIFVDGCCGSSNPVPTSTGDGSAFFTSSDRFGVTYLSLGEYRTRISVTDVAGNTATTTFPWTVFPAPMSQVSNGNAELPVLKSPGFVAQPPGDMIRRTGWLYQGAAGLVRAGAGQPAVLSGAQAILLQAGGSVSQRLIFRDGDILEFKTAASGAATAPALQVTLNGSPLTQVTPDSTWTTQRVTLSCPDFSCSPATIAWRNSADPATAGSNIPALMLDDVRLVHSGAGWRTVDVTGGDFETPALAAGASRNVLPPLNLPASSNFLLYGVQWTYTPDVTLVSAGNAALKGAPAPVNGKQVALLPGLGSSMTVQYGASTGHVLKFSATQGPSNAANAPQLVGVFVDGVQQGPALQPATGSWTNYAVPLSIAPGGPPSFRDSVEIRAVRGAAGEPRAVLIDKVATER